MTTALAEKTILDTEPVCRPARKSFAPILPARDIIVPIPADFRLTSGEALTDPVIRARLQGRPGAPLVIVAVNFIAFSRIGRDHEQRKGRIGVSRPQYDPQSAVAGKVGAVVRGAGTEQAPNV